MPTSSLASVEKQTDCIRMLLSTGADVDQAGSSGNSSILEASKEMT